MTMKTPEMEVVRFKEADVIVASGEPVVDSNYYASFSNLGPAANNAGLVIKSPNSTSVFNWEDLVKIDDSHILANVTFYNNNTGKTLHDLVIDETEACTLGDYNGEYVSRDGGNKYYRQ